MAEFLLNSKVSPQYLWFHSYGFNEPWTENIQEKNSSNFQKANLDLLHIDHYLHSIYIVLGIISNLKMI